jgi:hypothetical protein
LQYEAKLARAVSEGGEALARVADTDVKGLLLRALRDLGQAPASPGTEALSAALARHLGNVETQQALNLLALLHGGMFQLQVPLSAGKDLTTAFLAVEPDAGQGRRREGTARGYNVLFLLDLEGLGRTRIDAHFTGEAVRVVFYLEQAEALGRVEAGFPAFGGLLRSLGYDDVLLAARPVAELPAEKRQKLEAIARGVPTSGRLVDVRA